MNTTIQRITTVLLFALAPTAFGQDSGVSSELSRVATATAEEMEEYAADATQESRAIVRDLARLADSGKGDSDCVSNSLTAARALLQVADGAVVDLSEALETGERGRAELEFRKIAIALKKSRELQAEGERCGLGEASSDGKTRITVDSEDDTADTGSSDTDPVFDDPLDFGFDPPNASPF